MTDHVRSYEIVSGQGWNRLVAISLDLGKIVWQQASLPAPIENAAIDAGFIWVEQAGAKRWFNVLSGKEDRSVGDRPAAPDRCSTDRAVRPGR